MEYVFFGIAGLFGGVLGGMGMGGGTVLIPILTIIFAIGQHSAQAINLISFIPMAVVALIIHIKNHSVVFKDTIKIIVPGIITCIIGCYIARNLGGDILKRCFGGFLIVLSVFQVVSVFKKNSKID